MKIARLLVSLCLLLLAFTAIGYNLDWGVLKSLERFPIATLTAVTALFSVGVLLSSLRFQLIARDLGYHLGFREAVATVSGSQVAGILFLQIAGQVIARSAMLSRRNVPLAGTLIITAYERVSALVVAICLSVAGALFLFGELTLDLAGGGESFLKLLLGLVVALSAASAFVWADLLKSALAHFTASMATRFFRTLVLSLLIQITTMVAYVVLVRSLAPSVPLASVVAASTLVMFAAAIPISFAGWGVREMSAIFALGVIGVEKTPAVIAAVLVGVLSLAVVCLFAFATVGGLSARKETHLVPIHEPYRYDYFKVIAYALPLLVASVIFFQIFLPTSYGRINVNLADPLALMAGAVFLVHRVQSGAPSWRIFRFEWYVAAASFVMMAAFLHGYLQFGWSQWAFANKLLGWFVLLFYGATGALIVHQFKRYGFELLLKTFTAAAVALICFDILLIALVHGGLFSPTSFVVVPIEGFSQNRNAFAFLLLLAATIQLAARWPGRNLAFAIVVAGVWYTGSRTALIALPAVVVTALCLRLISIQFVLRSFLVATLIVCGVVLLPMLINPGQNYTLGASFSTAASDLMRFDSLKGGLSMFSDHAAIGAGLGAFFEQELSKGSGLVIHSTPIWLLAETGIVGLAIFLVPFMHIFIREFRRENRDVAARVLVLMIVTFAVFSTAHEILYQRAFWLLLGAACVLRYAPEFSQPEKIGFSRSRGRVRLQIPSLNQLRFV